MLKKPALQQQELELVSIEGLVPKQHLLRKVDGAVDFSFIRDRMKHLYGKDNGRSALDTVGLFKLLLLDYLYGVHSEQQLMREVEVECLHSLCKASKMIFGRTPAPVALRRDKVNPLCAAWCACAPIPAVGVSAQTAPV